MKAGDVRGALRRIGTGAAVRKAAPLLDDDARRRWGLTIEINPGGEEGEEEDPKEEDDDPDAETHGMAFDDAPTFPGRWRKRPPR